MSGFEVAGLVLAVFPVVVKGLQQFTDGVQTIKAWKYYRRELAKYSRTLETQRIDYLNTVEQLFEGIIQSNDELEELMENPAGAFSQYEESLRHRLDRSYTNYLDVMRDMLEALGKMRKEMGIDEQGKIVWDSLPSLARHVKRLKLVLSKNIHNDLLAQIDKNNNQLRKYTKETKILETARSRRRSRPPIDFKTIRRHARSLYNVLVTRRSWTCKCWKTHSASLRLEPRPWSETGEKEMTTQPVNLKFRVLLSKTRDDDPLDSIWKYQLEVAPVEELGNVLAGTCDDPQISLVSSLATSSIVQSSKSTSKKKEVNFSTIAPCPPRKQLWPAEAPNSLNQAMRPIRDMCSTLHDSRSRRNEIGFLKDGSVGGRRHDVYFIDERFPSGMDPASLEYLLDLPQQRMPEFALNRRDRLCIAVTLASSVLQLDGSLWLRKQWSSADILFLPVAHSKSAKPSLDLAHPYVSWKISPDEACPKLKEGSNSAHPPRQVRNDLIFALGVTLIELSLKQNISGMWIPEDGLQTKDGLQTEKMTTYNTASRLGDDVYKESGTRYADVVQRCLTCPFNLQNLRDFGLDNDEFQDAVFDHIFTPLKQDLEDFQGNQRIR